MQLPTPVRAFVGLIAVTAEEARRLPDRAVQLPMLAVSSALQVSLRAQQRYARLTARGDDVLNHRAPSDDPPEWATFDDPVTADELRNAGVGDPDPALRARAASQLLDELAGADDEGTAASEAAAPQAAARKRPPAKRAPAAKPPSRGARDAGVLGAVEAAGTPPARRTARPAAARKSDAGKSISRPRNTPPSRFDNVQDE